MPVTVLRAAVVIGHGGISWEITRQLVDHLPVMITPEVDEDAHPADRAGRRRPLPRSACSATDKAIGRTFEIGGPDVLRYIEMMRAGRPCQGQAAVHDRRPAAHDRPVVALARAVTDVDHKTARNLVDSMSNEVVVHDTSIHDVVPGDDIGYDEAVRRALADRARST